MEEPGFEPGASGREAQMLPEVASLTPYHIKIFFSIFHQTKMFAI